MTLEQFCEEHDLAYPQDNREFVLRPASLDEVGLFYSEEKLDEALGTVGHLRMDFGHGEKEFWHTWWPHNEDRFNTPEFKEVLQRFVDDLRQTGLLKNLGAMDAYCWQHGGSITEDRRSYGYIAETENYRFCLRCTPFPGEYQGYLYADLRPVIGSEQGGIRPVLILQNNVGNRHSPTVIAAPITSKMGKPRLPTHVCLNRQANGLSCGSVILLEQLRTIDKSRLRERVGALDTSEMKQIDWALGVSIGLAEGYR